MDEEVRGTTAMRVVLATLRLAQEDPEGAAAALEPMFAGASPIENPRWEIKALLLKARAEDALGDTGASSRALERALDVAEPDGLLLPFLLHPVPGAARAPPAASDLSRRADLRDPWPAVGTHSGGPVRGRRTAPRAALGERASRASLPAD